MVSSAIIELSNISKTFGNETLAVKALRNINLTIKSGEFISITGPSGSGKSSLLAVLGLLESADSGTFLFNGTDSAKLSVIQKADIRNEKIGFLFQSFNLIHDLSVLENVALPLHISQKNLSLNTIKSIATECLERVNLDYRQHHFPPQLSGGQQQLIAIARAMVNEPEILLLDEPTGNLDSVNGENIMNALEALNKTGMTICMVTHDQRYAERASRKIQMFDGVLYDS